jgi:hypothetical protein
MTAIYSQLLASSSEPSKSLKPYNTTNNKQQMLTTHTHTGYLANGSRVPRECFYDEQKIRHILSDGTTRIGIYDSSSEKIKFNGRLFSLNKFVEHHYIDERPDRVSHVNAWKECECEVGGSWFSTYDL